MGMILKQDLLQFKGKLRPCRPIYQVALLISFLLVSFPSSAVQVEGLFSAEVGVYDRSTEQRLEGIRQALEKVLVKVSGNRNVIFVPDIIPSDNEIERLVEQFGYSEIVQDEQEQLTDEVVDDLLGVETEIVTTTDELSADATDEVELQPTLKLWVGFDSTAVLRRLQQANLPVWDKTRPLVLVWLAVQEGGERYLLEPELHYDIKEIIEEQAAERGMPIVFPLMDLEDRTFLTASDVWGDFSAPIKQASKRYGADAILVVRLSDEGDSFWRTQWTLYHGDEANHWDSQGDSHAQTLTDGVHNSVDTLARRYAQVLLANLEPPLSMILHGVNHFEDYAKAVNYLEGLTQIASLNVFRVVRNKVEFNLSIRGSLEGLERVIRLGGILAKVDVEVAPQIPEIVEDPFTQEVISVDSLAQQRPSEKVLVYRLLP